MRMRHCRRCPASSSVLAAALLPLLLLPNKICFFLQLASAQSYFNSGAGRCPKPPSGNDKRCRCISVDDYDDLKGAIERMDDGECKCFEPFSVAKSSRDSPIYINNMKRITIVCQKRGQCSIAGPGTHLLISGSESETTFSGFRFQGATDSAIVVSVGAGNDSNSREQTICDSYFASNQNYWHNGGAIIAFEATNTIVVNSYFEGNKAARMGGAISAESCKVSVLTSTFVSNTAALGGAISSNQPDSALVLNGNSFGDDNMALLGPSYGPAVAANGLVQDLGENKANTQGFMCLGCQLQAGAMIKPYVPNLGHEDDTDEEEYYSSNNRVDGGNPEFLDYETYDAGDKWGPFHLKLYFGPGYQWQGYTKDLNVCLEYKHDAENVEGEEDPLMLNGCDEDSDEQRFVARGDKTIRLAEDENLCLTFVGDRSIEIHECVSGSVWQQWDRVQKKGHFKISPITDHNRCMTNHHHPREKERVYLDWCYLAEDGDTAFWTLRWSK